MQLALIFAFIAMFSPDFHRGTLISFNHISRVTIPPNLVSVASRIHLAGLESRQASMMWIDTLRHCHIPARYGSPSSTMTRLTVL